MPDSNKRKRRQWIGSVLLTIIVFAVCCTQILYSVDKFVSDPLYYTSSVPDSRIKIVAIDEETIQKYGDIRTWDRKIWAELVELLNSGDEDPAVIALDIMYIGALEEASDTQFAKACKSGDNVITAVNAVYGTELGKEGGTISADNDYIEMVEYPYDELKEVSSYGFANILQDKDGYIRYAREYIDYNGERIDFFPVAVYRVWSPSFRKPFTAICFPLIIRGRVVLMRSFPCVMCWMERLMSGRLLTVWCWWVHMRRECRMLIMCRFKKAARCMASRFTQIFWNRFWNRIPKWRSRPGFML